jgi:putative oxidoreductase
MTTHAIHPLGEERIRHAHTPEMARYLVPIGRLLFALIFLVAAPGLFTQAEIAMAADHGVPLASIAVPLAGVLAVVGGLSVLLGARARAGAWLLVVFLIPVTLYMHAFWAVPDPGARMIQQIMFLKNLSMLGAALLLAYFGAGPVSVDSLETAHSRDHGDTPSARSLP